MDRILLIRTYAPVVHPSLCPPLGIMYIASAIRCHAGAQKEICILDMRLGPKTLKEVQADVERFRPDMVGLSALTHEAETVHNVARAVKEMNPTCCVVAGGPHPSMFFDEVLKDPSVDMVVVGEGDRAIVDLLSALEAGDDPARVPGIASRGKNGTVRYDPRLPVEDLDSIPFPAWDLIDLEGYSRRPNMNSMLKGSRYMAILTSRGCPYGCAYCHNLFGRTCRTRSPQNVYQEMELLRKEFGVDEFHIVDDIFNLDKERAHAICDLMIQGRLGVSLAFPNGLRGDIMDRDLIHKLVRAGCYSMTYAVETATPRLQRLIGKNMSLPRVQQAIEWSFDAGVVTKGFFMLGFPSETLEEIHRTISFARRSKLLLAGFYCVVPFPRTPLLELARKEDPSFSPDVSAGFYYASEPYYTKKTGVDLKSLQRYANRTFYLSPRRLWNLWLRIPHRRDLLANFKPFVQLAFDNVLPWNRSIKSRVERRVENE